jgi:glycosyltransferase involved in cell wall biosynthesis
MIIALTNSEREVLLKLNIPEERITVTGIGPILAEQPHPENFRERHAIRGPIVLFLGQHYDYKGFTKILQAAPYVWRRHPQAEFVFIGPPVGNSEKHFRGVDRRIHRLGMVDLQEKTDALSAASVLCVPSSQESFGGVYVEAWAVGRPVVGCRIPAVSEVISDGVDGLLVDQEFESVANAICEVLDDPVRADRMGAAGRDKVRLKYGWNALAKATIAAYQTALGTATKEPMAVER